MKILHVGKYFSPFSGGLENYMRDAMVALARRGIDSIALVHRHSLSFRTTDETFEASGHKFHVIKTGMWARFLYTPISPTFPWHLRRIIKTAKPDILHLHLPNPSVFWALALPSARRLPWAVHWHSDVITSTQGPLMSLFYTLYRPFEHAVLKRAEVIVATSTPYRDSSLPLQKWLNKCRVVPLGVDTERYANPNGKGPAPVGGASRGDYVQDERYIAMEHMDVRRDRFSFAHGKENRREDAPPTDVLPTDAPPTDVPPTDTPPTELPPTAPPLQVLAVGRLTYYKGFRYLIEAAAQAPGIKINLVGLGEEEDQLKSLAASLKLQDRVTFHGALSEQALTQQMADCDCLCLPSIERTEAFGMVLLEAMYFGKATVIGDVAGSGMGWVVDDGVTGIKVNPEDADALAKAFSRLATNREELKQMGQRGKQKFDEQFEINHAVAGLVEIYNQVTKIPNQTDVISTR